MINGVFLIMFTGNVLTTPGTATTPLLYQEIQPTVVPENKIPEKIEIGTIESVLGIIVILITAGIAWGSLKSIVREIKTTLDATIKPDLKDVRERFGVVEDRVATIWKDKFAPSNSPRQLNDKGNSVLENSGIKKIIEEKKDILLQKVREKNPETAYDAELIIQSVVNNLPKHCPDMVNKLKTGAFKVGQSMDVVLFVGGIYLRNLIFKDLGFSLNELDSNVIVKKD